MANSNDLLELGEAISEAATGLGEVVNSIPWLTGAYQQFCRIQSGTPGGQALQLLDIGNVCAPYWAADGIAPPSQGPPFSGGQCPGEQYRVEVSFAPIPNGLPSPQNVLLGQGGAVLSFGPVPQAGPPGVGTVFAIRSESTGGVRTSIGLTADESSIQFGPLFTESGNPDNCGDPPSQFLPSPDYGGESYGDPFQYTDPGGRPWEITVGAPRLDADGNLEIPITVDGNEINVGVPGAGDQGPSGVFRPGATTSGAGIAGDGEDGPQDVPEGGPGLRCVAIALQVSGFPVGLGRVPRTGGNERFYEPIGNFSVRVRSDDGTEAYQSDDVIRSERTLRAIDVEGLTITGFRVNLLPGLSYVATPIYRDETEDVTDDG